MKNYSYVAKDSTGKTLKGVMEAEDEQQVQEKVYEQGLFLISTTEALGGTKTSIYKFKTKDLAFSCRQLAAMLTSGLTIVKALDIMYKEEKNKGAKNVWLALYEDVNKGSNFTEALIARNGSFPDFMISMIDAGESAGNLDITVQRLSDFYANQNNARRCTDNSPACRRNRRARRKKPGFEGDPTEVALLRFCTDMGIDLEKLPMERIGEKPFDSESKYMSVTCRDGEGRQAVFAKGAPEKMIAMCTHRFEDGGAVPLEESARAALLRKNEEYAAQGLRVIALCGSAGDTAVFLGLAAMSDPLRPQAAEAVRECRRAGISTVMITGDHKLTACAIAKEAGILTGRKRVVTGSELDEMTDAELAEQIGEIAVYARVTPAHKLRIVRACKQKGMVCAMTGDGVNDAPAVKEASIGVSMGISGTDVTKQAADMILLDDNFATLVSAVREGRTIYANIRKFVRYLIACNIGEVLTMLGAILMGLPMALVPAQLLLVNLVTDGLPAAALSVEPAEKGVMGKPPRREEDSFFSGGLMTKIVARGVAIALCTLACFTLLLPSGLAAARTGAMLTLVFSQLIHVFECRSEDKTLLQMGLRGGKFVVLAALSSAACVVLCMAVPQLAAVFSLTKMSAKQLAISLSFAAAAAVFSAIGSAFRKRV